MNTMKLDELLETVTDETNHLLDRRGVRVSLGLDCREFDIPSLLLIKDHPTQELAIKEGEEIPIERGKEIARYCAEDLLDAMNCYAAGESLDRFFIYKLKATVTDDGRIGFTFLIRYSLPALPAGYKLVRLRANEKPKPFRPFLATDRTVPFGPTRGPKRHP